MSVKRKSVSINGKLEVIKALESGQKKSEVARNFNLAYSTVNSIWCSRAKFEEAAEKNLNCQTKRLRKPIYEDLDQALFKWFVEQKSLDIPVNGPILHNTAVKLADTLGIQNYVCCNAWIDRFKKRYNINFKKICGKTENINKKVIKDWNKNDWTAIRKKYQEEDIFIGDETDLFFKMNPNSIHEFQNKKCNSGTMFKERLVVFVCANATGTEKRDLLVIGKSQEPHSFKNVKKPSVKYIANSTSLMTTEIFGDEIKTWDEELDKERRKIVLILNKSKAHLNLQESKSIKLIFFPANTTSVFKQDVIENLICFYRKQLVLEAIEKQGEKFDLNKTTILDACKILMKAWKDVSVKTIRTCFIRSELACDQNEENELTLYRLPTDSNNFLNYDETAVKLKENEMLTEASLENIEETKDDENETDEQPPTLAQARHHLRQLTYFYECAGDEYMLGHLGKIEVDLDQKLLFTPEIKYKVDVFNRPMD